VWALSPQASAAAVELVYFTGHGSPGFVHLEWETATELDNVGFYILRSATESGSFARISPFIPTGPDSIAGYQYGFVDANVVDGTGYWYQLESVDTATLSSFHGPILVIAGVFATQAPTATATQTGQVGSIATSTRTSNPTRTRTPTNTTVASFGQLASTPLGASTPISTGLSNDQVAGTQAALQSTQSALSVTDTLTATATLIPVPEITLQFPTEVVEPVVSDQQADLERAGSNQEGPRRVWFTLERLIFLGFILLVWILLAGWFYLTYSRTEK